MPYHQRLSPDQWLDYLRSIAEEQITIEGIVKDGNGRTYFLWTCPHASNQRADASKARQRGTVRGCNFCCARSGPARSEEEMMARAVKALNNPHGPRVEVVNVTWIEGFWRVTSRCEKHGEWTTSMGCVESGRGCFTCGRTKGGLGWMPSRARDFPDAPCGSYLTRKGDYVKVGCGTPRSRKGDTMVRETTNSRAFEWEQTTLHLLGRRLDLETSMELNEGREDGRWEWRYDPDRMVEKLWCELII